MSTTRSQAPIWPKTVIGYGVIAFVLFFVIKDPYGAARVINNIGNFLSSLAGGFAAFMQSASAVWLVWALIISVALFSAWPLSRLLQRRRSIAPAMTNLITGGLTSIGAFLAGRQRSYLREAWHADLVKPQDSGKGYPISNMKKITYATSFVRAGVSCRVADSAKLWWRLADGILASRVMSRIILICPCLTAAFMIIRHEGIYGLVANADNLIKIGALSATLIYGGRKLRKIAVKPSLKPPPKTSDR